MTISSVKIAAIATVCAIALFGAWAVYSFSINEGSNEVSYEDVETIDGLTITYVSGTHGGYELTSNSVSENTVKFNKLTEDSVYELSGTLKGNLEIDCGSYDLELRLNGMSISSGKLTPIEATSCGTLTITICEGTENRVSDFRNDQDSAYAIVSGSSTNVSGEGSLWIESTHNGGISSADDLLIDAASVSVESQGNSIVSGDALTVTSDSLSTMSHAGTGMVGVDVTIDGTSNSVYAQVLSCAIGVNATDDLVVNGDVELTIHTSSMSKRSERTNVYVGYANKNFTFSLKVQTPDGTTWVNPSGDPTLVHRAISKSYVYEFEVPDNATTFEVYAYSSNQVQGQDTSYYAKSASINKDFGRSSILITQCAQGMEIMYVPADYGGPGMPDMGESRTIGLCAGNELSITDANVTVRSEGPALLSENSDVTISGTRLTAFSLSYTIKASGNIAIDDGKTVLFCESDKGFVLSYGKSLSFNDSYLVGICKDTTEAESIFETISASVKATSTNLDSLSSGTYLNTVVDGTTVSVVTIPDGSTGAPPVNFDDQMNGVTAPEGEMNVPKEGMQGPEGMTPVSTMAIFLGSDDADMSITTETSCTLDKNGVYWI